MRTRKPTSVEFPVPHLGFQTDDLVDGLLGIMKVTKTTQRLCFACVHRSSSPESEYEWMTVHDVKTLDEATQKASIETGVDRVIEVCWDTGYVT